MATVGYARVSTIGQNLDVQLEKLREYGCEEIFEEKRSGRFAARLARSTLDLHRILEQLQENEVGFVVLDQAIVLPGRHRVERGTRSPRNGQISG